MARCAAERNPLSARLSIGRRRERGCAPIGQGGGAKAGRSPVESPTTPPDWMRRPAQQAPDRESPLRPSSRASTLAVMAPSDATSAGVRASKTSERTVRTWSGAARSIAVRPAGVSTTNAPRPSSPHSSRTTRPRRCMRVTWCESRLRSQPSAAARPETRTRPSAASVSWTSTSKSCSERSESRWSWRLSAAGSREPSASQARQTCCCASSSQGVSSVVACRQSSGNG